MARPKKENAEYFSHDANMRNDPKVKALRKKFKEGYSVYNMFLEYLTDCSFFEVEMTELEFEILSGDFDVEVEILKEILEYCIKIGLLSRLENNIFSNGLKKRLQPVLDKRNNAKDKFLQIKLKENEQKELKSYVSVTETTQSKVKESKVKESKEVILLKKESKADLLEESESEKINFYFDSEIFKTQWQIWKAFRKKSHKFQYFNLESEQKALTELFNLSDENEKIAVEIIKQSIAKGWKGFFKLKNAIKEEGNLIPTN